MFGDTPQKAVDPRAYVGHTLRVSPTQNGLNPWLCTRAYAAADGWHLVLRYPDRIWDVRLSFFSSIQVIDPAGGQSFGTINEAAAAGW